MKSVQLRDAKAKLSALIDAAERGQRTTITRHGRPAAVLVPIADAAKLEDAEKLSFAEMLMAIPGKLPYVRDRRPMRRVKL